MPLQSLCRGSAVTQGNAVATLGEVRAFVINPRRDADFVAKVEEEGQSARSPDALEASLREQYPQAVVRPRQLEGERAEVWYVYRDGAWVAE